MAKRKFRKNYALGMKAGAVTGLIYGLFISLLFIIFSDLIEYVLKQVFDIHLANFAQGMIIIGFVATILSVIALTLFGLLFVLLINVLPSNSMYLKACLLATVFWLKRGIVGLFYAPVLSIINLVMYALVGIVFAFFYIFFAKRMK